MTHCSGLVRLRDLHREIEREPKIKIDISKTEYPLLRQLAANELGWKVWGRQDSKGEVNLFWNDTYISEEHIKRLKPYQRVNHFPNSHELGKKNLLSDNLKKMRALMPKQYDFFPQTWNLPEEEEEFQSSAQQKKWFIVKPSSSSQGKGIYLTKDTRSISKEGSVVQEYITNPHIIDGCKYDLRIYVFIKSLNPLKVFRFEEGLTRLATHSYEQPTKLNKKNMNMHLTNYAINRLNPAYVSNKNIQADSEGHKRSLASAYKSMQDSGCDIQKLQGQIDEVIVKTILSAYPKMLESYKSCRDCEIEGQSVCFEILGFDILVDSNFKPWLLEVNHSPSFATDSPLDFVVKKFMVLDTLLLLNLKSEDKQLFIKKQSKEQSQKNILKDRDTAKVRRSQQTVYESKNLGGYTQIYPSTNNLYKSVLQKLYAKKSFSKIVHRALPQPEPRTEQPSPIVERYKNPYFTFYGQFQVLRGKRVQCNEQDNSKSDEAIKRHVSFERERRDKKKQIQPMKMNNVSINFIEDMKTQYQNGFQTRATSNNAHRPAVNTLKGGKNLESYQSETKTSDGSRKQIKMLDYEIRSRIGKIKLARIRLQKIKSTSPRRELPNTSRIMRSSQLRQELKNSSKII